MIEKAFIIDCIDYNLVQPLQILADWELNNGTILSFDVVQNWIKDSKSKDTSDLRLKIKNILIDNFETMDIDVICNNNGVQDIYFHVWW